jgi:predicted negative regulator of RcsB-dependent stress response
VDSEQEELEALQKWWKDNGKAVVVGLVIGLGGVFAWTTWQSRVESTAVSVSVIYQSMVDMAAADDHAEALLRAEQLTQEHADSEYAALSALLGAKSALALARNDDAMRLLGWVIAHAARPELRDLARIRSARLDFAGDRAEQGLAILAEVKTPAFAATVEELRGDILADGQQNEAAVKAYEAALASPSITSGERLRVNMKLDDLGHRSGADMAQ